MTLTKEAWEDLILDARLHTNKSVKDLLDDAPMGYLLDSDEVDLVTEIVYDSRNDHNFDYLKAARDAGLLEAKKSKREITGSFFITGSLQEWSTVNMAGLFLDDNLIATTQLNPEDYYIKVEKK